MILEIEAYERMIDYRCPDGKIIRISKDFLLENDVLFDDEIISDHVLGLYIPEVLGFYTPKSPTGYMNYHGIYLDMGIISSVLIRESDAFIDNRTALRAALMETSVDYRNIEFEGQMDWMATVRFNFDWSDTAQNTSDTSIETSTTFGEPPDSEILQICPICGKEKCHCYDDIMAVHQLCNFGGLSMDFDISEISWVNGIVRRKIKNAEDAEEVIQDIYIRVWKSEWDPAKGTFHSWVSIIMKNQITDYFRQRDKQQMKDAIVCSNASKKHEPLLCVQTSAEEISEMIMEIEKLKENYRRVLKLHLQGYSSPEIAELLHCSENTVRVWQYRARLQLKKILAAAI